MKKRLVRLIPVVCMAFLIFSILACNTSLGATTKEFTNKNLDIAIFQGGFGKAYWEAVVQKFEEAYPGVKVNMTINPQVGEIIRPRIVAGNPPDFLSLNDGEHSGVVAALIKEKGLLDISKVFKGKALDKNVPLKDIIIPGLLTSVKFAPYGNGKVYLAPFNIGPMGLIYNKALFDKKGWAVPKTVSEFLALGETAKQDGRALFTYQGIYPDYLESMLYPLIGAAGGQKALDKIFNYEKGSFKNAAVKKVLTVFADIAKKGYLMKGTVALNHTQSQGDMMMGKALFIPNGTWMEGEMKDAPREEGFKFAMMPAPVFKAGDKPFVAISYEQFSIPAKAKNPELAKEFLRFLYTETSVKLFGEKANGIFAVKGARELVKANISESNYNFFSVFDNGTTLIPAWKTLPQGTKVNINQEIFYKNVSAIMNGDETVDQWMDNVEKAFAQVRDEFSKVQ